MIDRDDTEAEFQILDMEMAVHQVNDDDATFSLHLQVEHLESRESWWQAFHMGRSTFNGLLELLKFTRRNEDGR